MPVTTTPLHHDAAFSLRLVLQLPASLAAALLPWWSALVLALLALADGGVRPAVTWAAAGLLYSCFVTAAVLFGMLSEPG